MNAKNAADKTFDRFHPKHAGHPKTYLAVTSLRLTAHCDLCNVDLYVTLAAALVDTFDDKWDVLGDELPENFPL